MKTFSKTLVSLAALAAVGAATAIVNHLELPAAKLTVMVVDENDQPVENATVCLGFGDVSVKGLTDVKGLFTGEGRCNISGVGSTITKAGYYLGFAPTPSFHERDEALNRWKPWNETCKTILRPKIKPVALNTKKVNLQIPALDQRCGFDLEAGDWVEPNGKGTKNDFIFTLHQDWRGISDYSVNGELTFGNVLDGLREASIPDMGSNSVFKWERLAYENGYEPTKELMNAWYPQVSGKQPIRSFKSPDVWSGFFFRVRTFAQNGQIVSAHYGKIRGGIAVYPNEPKPKIVFTYYFNPVSLDRNLEWDPERNLFSGLSFEQSPREP